MQHWSCWGMPHVVTETSVCSPDGGHVELNEFVLCLGLWAWSIVNLNISLSLIHLFGVHWHSDNVPSWLMADSGLIINYLILSFIIGEICYSNQMAFVNVNWLDNFSFLKTKAIYITFSLSLGGSRLSGEERERCGGWREGAKIVGWRQ